MFTKNLLFSNKGIANLVWFSKKLRSSLMELPNSSPVISSFLKFCCSSFMAGASLHLTRFSQIICQISSFCAHSFQLGLWALVPTLLPTLCSCSLPMCVRLIEIKWKCTDVLLIRLLFCTSFIHLLAVSSSINRYSFPLSVLLQIYVFSLSTLRTSLKNIVQRFVSGQVQNFSSTIKHCFKRKSDNNLTIFLYATYSFSLHSWFLIFSLKPTHFTGIQLGAGEERSTFSDMEYDPSTHIFNMQV